MSLIQAYIHKAYCLHYSSFNCCYGNIFDSLKLFAFIRPQINDIIQVKLFRDKDLAKINSFDISYLISKISSHDKVRIIQDLNYL